MIRFSCPQCRSIFETPDAQGGQKVNCSRCGQRLKIPVLPPNKTVLAPLVSHAPDPGSPPLPSANPVVPVPTRDQKVAQQWTPQDESWKQPTTGTWFCNRTALLVCSVLLGSSLWLALSFIIVGGVRDHELIWLEGALVFFLAAIVICWWFWVILADGTKNACVRCRRWWARLFQAIVILNQKKCYGLVTRSSSTFISGGGSTYGGGSVGDRATCGGQHYSGSSSTSWTASGNTTWEERAPVIRTTYQLQYLCQFCGEMWEEEKVEEFEDFDIERD